MAYAVELYFDDVFSKKVELAWQRIHSELAKLNSRPHISLTVIDSGSEKCLMEIIERFAQTTSTFRVHFSSLATFSGSESVVFLAPVVTSQLLSLHQTFHEELSAFNQKSWSYYMPGNWVPHCTLAQEASGNNIAKIIQNCRQDDLFTEAQIIEIGLVKSRPFTDLGRFPLRKFVG